MTRNTTARLAGLAFLLYIVAGLASMALSGRATAGAGTAEQLASLARHAFEVRLTILLDLLANLCALVLGVTLYALTREEDATLALLAMVCRVAEGIGGIGTQHSLDLLWLAGRSGSAAPDAPTQALGALYLKPGGFGPSAFFFALGSTIFAWLLLRGRMIPAPLAWLGVVGSALVLVVFPVQLAGFVSGAGWFETLTKAMWLPLLVFEVWLAVLLLAKGLPAPRRSAEVTPSAV